MPKKSIRLAGLVATVLTTTILAYAEPKITQGSLIANGLECPLKHTDVKAEISGAMARVTVTQDFVNSAESKVEAVYVFPLPHNAAVDDMTMQVGDRLVKGSIRRRSEARALYDAARTSGRVAALLDQERPNIFTQSVANIAPGAKVRITISYVERVPYEAGTYEFVFPMVVGPRYKGTEPGVAPKGLRAGHDISVEVKLDAGVPLDSVLSPSHEVAMERPSKSRAAMKLLDKATIPNKDFLLRYDVAGRKISDAVLTHRTPDRGGFFSLILQPPERVTAAEVTPKEIVFVLDTSGSMNGFPIEKAKESMRLAIEGLNPKDTFNLITFAGDTHILFPEPVAATPENLAKAREFLASRYGSGGTEMMKAIRASLAGSDHQDRVRVVCFMTDGYVGNEAEILAEIRRNSNARVFAFGIGPAVNRYLLDKMAEAGRGEVEYVSLQDDGSAAAKRFHERVRNPLMTDISIEWNGLPVSDGQPTRIPDLFSAKPLVITGKYSAPAKGTIRLRGRMAGVMVTRDIPVDLPASQPANSVLATLWARATVDHLSHEPGHDEEITNLGLKYRLMTAFTSFVAVEETTIVEGGVPRRVQVPVELPEGVSHDGIYGNGGGGSREMAAAAISTAMTFMPRAGLEGKSMAAPPPPPMVSRRPEPLQDMTRQEVRQKIRLDPKLAGRTGEIRVQILLTEAATPALETSLKTLGVQVLSKMQSGKLLIVRVDAAKLRELSTLEGVRWITEAVMN